MGGSSNQGDSSWHWVWYRKYTFKKGPENKIKLKKDQSLRDLCDYNKRSLSSESQKERKKRVELKILKDMMAEDFPNLARDINL